MSSYSPGTCNIGPTVRRRRFAVAVVGFAVAVASVVAIVAGIVPDVLLAAVFVPLWVAFEWGLQASRAFCTRLAVRGVYDFSGQPGGERGEVSDPTHHGADVRQATIQAVVAVALAALSTAGVVLVVGSRAVVG